MDVTMDAFLNCCHSCNHRHSPKRLGCACCQAWRAEQAEGLVKSHAEELGNLQAAHQRALESLAEERAEVERLRARVDDAERSVLGRLAFLEGAAVSLKARVRELESPPPNPSLGDAY